VSFDEAIIFAEVKELLDGLVAVDLNLVVEVEMAEEFLDFDDGLRGFGLFLESKKFINGHVEMNGLVHVKISFGFVNLVVYRDVAALKLLVDLKIEEFLSVVVRVDQQGLELRHVDKNG
jgi:hypothetical protein